MQKRTPKQSHELVEQTIREIRTIASKQRRIKPYIRDENITDALISRICTKNDIGEEIIRLVGNWHKKKINFDY